MLIECDDQIYVKPLDTEYFMPWMRTRCRIN